MFTWCSERLSWRHNDSVELLLLLVAMCMYVYIADIDIELSDGVQKPLTL